MKVSYKGFEFEVTQRAWSNRRSEPTFDPARRNKISKKLRHRIYKRDGYKCVECGSKEFITIDHIIPISQGGPDRENNMQTLCIVCNQRKGSKILTEKIRI